MRINKVLISESNEDIEINGSLDCKEAKQLESMAKRFAYRLGFIGGQSIDCDAYRVFMSVCLDARIRYEPNPPITVSRTLDNNKVKRSDFYPGGTLNFTFSYGQTPKVMKFLEKFQKKFGKIDKSKIIYE